jgi:hypothetical protein
MLRTSPRRSSVWNVNGVSAVNSASINTYGDNRNDGNTADGAFTLPIIPGE